MFEGLLDWLFLRKEKTPSAFEIEQMIEEDKKTNPMWIAHRKQQADLERWYKEFDQIRSLMDHCNDLMRIFGRRLPDEDWKQWMLREEPWPCLPLSIKPFIT